MNIVIIVGHPASGFEEVESRLQQCGMKAALPSRREGVLPKDISSALCIAHQAPAPDSVTSESGFRQIEAGMVWHGMALDLLLGNLEQELWGWSDTRCIFLLDYWRMLDPKITFVLVYDEPQRAIAEAALRESDELDEKKVRQLLENWAAYNGAMLGFFLRNPERCLLVHAQQVHRALEDHLAQLRSRLKAPPEVASAALRDRGTAAVEPAASSGIKLMAAPLTKALHDALTLINEEPSKALDAFHSDPAQRFIIQGLLSEYPECLQLYEELQSAANLPLNAADADADEHGLAWKALVAQRQFVAQILGELHRRYQSLEELTRNTSLEHHLLQEQFLEMRGELESSVIQNLEQTAILQNFQHTEREAAEYRMKIHELQAQTEQSAGELAITQCLLKQIQVDLETTHAENLDLRQSGESQRVEHKVAVREAAEHLMKLQELQAQNEQSAGDLAITQGLLKQIQVELETSHAETLSLHQSGESHRVEHKVAVDAILQNLQHAERLAEERLMSLHELQVQNEQRTGEQAITQGLLRQIQNELETSHAESLSLQQSCARQVAEHKGAVDAVLQKLAQVEQDLETCRTAAGQRETGHQRAMEELQGKLVHLENEKEQLDNAVSTAQINAQSAERVKQQLSYRLGSTIVAQSRSFGGWLGMPFAIMHVFRDFNKCRRGEKN